MKDFPKAAKDITNQVDTMYTVEELKQASVE